MTSYSIPRHVRLQLPEPPNTLQRATSGSHWSWEYKQAVEWKRLAWVAAWNQQMPFPHPPLKYVRWRISVELRLRNRRDAVDNAPGSLKFLLDTLKAKHAPQDSLKWKVGDSGEELGTNKAYIWDDAERWLVRGAITQKVVRRKPTSFLEVTPETRGMTVALTIEEVYEPTAEERAPFAPAL